MSMIEIKGSKMKEINDEIKLTITIMQTCICEGAHDELQGHLYSLLEMKRNELQKRLTGPRVDSAAHKLSPEILWGEVKLDEQLTADELRAGGWWCADTSEDALKAFILMGIKDGEYGPWDGSYYACFLFKAGINLVDRGNEHHTFGLKQIHRVGNEFYWS